MVMEFLRGEDLRHAIKNGHTGDLRGKLKIAVQVARALAYIHTQKIIHRDIKPENVHISPAGVVKLMDFGIAKTEGLADDPRGLRAGDAVLHGAGAGDSAQDITEQVDVYAFGVLLFELMTGAQAHRRRYRGAHLLQHSERAAQPGAAAPGGRAAKRCATWWRAAPRRTRPSGRRGSPPWSRNSSASSRTRCAHRSAARHGPSRFPAPASRDVAARMADTLDTGNGRGARSGHLLRRQAGREASPQTAGSAAGPCPTLTAKGGDMVLVDAGGFLFGEKKEPDTLPAFYIDKTEVSNANYAEFCAETRHALPNGFPSDKPDLPVVNVLILDARAFAQWAGKRLPKGREWEKAARGRNGFLYPWGNEIDPARANVGSGTLLPVSGFPTGASPYGALKCRATSGNWSIK